MTPSQTQLATKQLVRDMVEEFGAKRAAVYCSLGYSWSQAISAHCDWLTAQNERLRKQLAQLDLAERVPLSSGGADVAVDRKRAGFADRINLR